MLASNVCDHPRLVVEGRRGFLFDQRRPQSIAKAIAHFCGLGGHERREMGDNARLYAEQSLGVEKMMTAYETLLAEIIRTASTGNADE